MPYNPNKKPINRSRIRNLEMDDKWIIRFLKKVQVGHFVTMDKDQPFINPSSFWYDSKKHEIYFHSNAYGRMRYNAENQSNASFECFKSGRLLPSNLALEMSFQYECVIAFGTIMVVQEIDEKKEILNGLLQKYFGEMKPNRDYRGVTKQELNQTSVYRFKIKNWSGKRNWVDKADQAENNEWPDLDPMWFEFY